MKTQAQPSAHAAETPVALSSFLTQYLENSHRGGNYGKMYSATMKHVLNFCSYKGMPQPLTNGVNAGFCEGFIFYLKSVCRHRQNTVKAHLERLQAIVGKAAMSGYAVNGTFREISLREEEVNSVYLTMQEITHLYSFGELTGGQQEIRDVFILGCLTGLRYSDYSRLTENNFIDNFRQIKVKTRKTGVVVQLPAHRYVREILEKYGYRLPQRRSTQYFNKAIKQICQKSGLDQKQLSERTQGTEVNRKICGKWELISSHTARRSFATNMFLMGAPPYRIMLITGHRSEKASLSTSALPGRKMRNSSPGILFFNRRLSFSLALPFRKFASNNKI